MKVRIISLIVLIIATTMISSAAASGCCQCYGLTPGYWKHWTNEWPVPTTTTFEQIGINAPGTLLDALNYQGSGDPEHILLRAAAAAYLNSLSSNSYYGSFTPGLVFPLPTQYVIYIVNDALASGDRSYMLSIKDHLETFNQLGDLVAG